jgi:hypothetical protein
MIARFRPWRSSRRLLAVAAALLIGVVPPVSARDFDVEQVTTRLEDGTFVMDAQIDYDFSERALEALDNGVPLTVGGHIPGAPARTTGSGMPAWSTNGCATASATSRCRNVIWCRACPARAGAPM